MNEVKIGHTVRAKSSTLSIQRYLRAITPLLAINMPSGAAANAAVDEVLSTASRDLVLLFCGSLRRRQTASSVPVVRG
jgi:hypothetical protein